VKKWAYALSTDALLFGCFYLWQFQHIEAARSFLVFVFWTFAVLMMFAGLFVPVVRRSKQSGIYTLYAHMTTVATIGLMVWTNMVAVAITFFIGWILVQGKIKETPEVA